MIRVLTLPQSLAKFELVRENHRDNMPVRRSGVDRRAAHSHHPTRATGNESVPRSPKRKPDSPISVRITLPRQTTRQNARGYCIQNCVGIRREKVQGKQLENRKMPNVLPLNARSLVKKVNELEDQIESHNADITFVTETWLAELVPDEVVNCSVQTIIRKDRPNGKGRRGVAIYFNDRIPIKLSEDLNDPFYAGTPER